ncbi:ABC-2 family transporter protein [Candidatus Gottesmanbacteria bacterium]|nr:ABC-2 family transporter protein [Candidatus Gottesmanbacteria bacterium]
MVDKISYYFKVWRLYTIDSFSVILSSRFSAIIFTIAKFFRFIFFLLFLVFILRSTNSLGGYSEYEVVFFYLTFSLIDSVTQLLFREVYRFRSLIVEGSFDYILLKPINSLFRSLTGGADLLDLFMLIPIIILLVFSATKTGMFTPFNTILFLVFIFNSLILTTAFHILVLAIGILTTSVDHTVLIYRDVVSTGRLPIDVYREPVRGFLTFILPVAIVMTVPAKAFLGKLPIELVIVSFIFAAVIFIGSLKLWRYSLTKYSSASS